MQDRKKIHISISGADPHGGNRGLGALCFGALEAVVTAFPEAELYLLDFYKEKGTITFLHDLKEFRASIISMRYSKKLYLTHNIVWVLLGTACIRLFPGSVLEKKLLKHIPPLASIKRLDVCLAVCGGDSFSDIYGFKQFFYTIASLVPLVILNKKIIFLPQTYGPFRSLFVRWIAKLFFLQSHALYSRDKESLEYVRALYRSTTINTKLHLCYDVGFLLLPQKPSSALYEQFQKPPLLCGLNVSGLLYHKQETFSLAVNYKKIIDSLLKLLITEMHLPVLLVPHVYSSYYDNDWIACQKVFSQWKNEYGNSLLFFDEEFSARHIKYIIGQCDFFIGSRMHACIAALSQAVPAVSLAYSRKFIGVMNTLAVNTLLLDLKKDTEDIILSTINERFKERDAMHRHLLAIMPQVKDTIRTIFVDSKA